MNKEMIEFVRDKLLEQNRQCKDVLGGCYYHKDGNFCAVGHLIDLPLGHPAFETLGDVEYLFKVFPDLPLKVGSKADMLTMIELQNIHDHYEPTQWPPKFEELLNECD